ncbi:MAG TPA: lactate racemase domain-containing protein [Terriglobia bacterium]|nr:lactate racemase domain-containing protein [Terriglobia bacterium]
MSQHVHVPISSFRLLQRTSPTMPGLADVEAEVRQSLSSLAIPRERLAGKSVAVTAGSRGIANLKEIIRASCGWLKSQGAHPFVFPAMGSHGGATAQGQRLILDEYGVTPDFVGADVKSDMETIQIGETEEGFPVNVDRNAWEADSILVVNRIKPHTDFTGSIESGLLKMIAVGIGKREGAAVTHRWSRRYGNERVIRSIAGVTLGTGKILCGLAVAENEMHQIAVLRACLPEGIAAMEEAVLPTAKDLVPRLPFSKCQLLVVDEMGKNISGTGIDTKVVGRGARPLPDYSPEISLIYVRDLTDESGGNSIGVGMADAIHERFYRKIELSKMYMNARTSLNPMMARVPIHLPSDREALDYMLATLGTPDVADQRIIWIRNTLELNRVAVSSSYVKEAGAPAGWQMLPEEPMASFDHADDLVSPFQPVVEEAHAS